MLKKISKGRSLITRLIWLNILAIISVSVLIGVWARNNVIEDSRSLGIERLQVLNQRISTVLDEELTQRKKYLGHLATQLSEVIQLKPLSEIQKMIDNRFWLHEAFKGGLVVLNSEGRVLLDSPNLERRVGLYLGDRDYFLWVKKHKQSYISKPVIARAIAEPAYIISNPILDANGNFLGAVNGVTKLLDDVILNKVSRSYLGKNSHVYVLDFENQLIVTSSNKDLIMQPLAQLNKSGVLKEVIDGSMYGESVSNFGGDVIYSASRIEQTGWVVLNTYPSSNWVEHANKLVKQIFWISLISTLIIISFSVYYLRNQLLPLQTTKKALARMGEPGAKAEPIAIRYDDELGALVKAFNSLLGQLKKNEAKLVIASEKAEAASRAKSQFLSNISHEIKTPLNAVLTLAYIQLEHTFDPEGRLRLKKIQSSGRALLAVMNDILSFIELENKNVSTTISSFNLEEVLAEIVQEYAQYNADKPIEFLFEIERGIPTSLRGDSQHLLQVLGHLLSNAGKFTEQGHVVVRVTQLAAADSDSSDKLTLQFCVTDTGKGISAEKLGQLFEVFRQVDETDSRAFAGIGIGLALSNRLIQLIGGSDISVESELNKGSSFCFTVPLSVDARQAEFKQQLPLASKQGTAFIIDDQEISRDVLSDILSDWSITSESANSLDVALKKLRETAQATENSQLKSKRYGAIFLDWSLPGTQGEDALNKIEALYQQIPNAKPPVFIMATASEAELIEFDTAASYPIILKPLSRSAVYDAINQVISEQRPSHEPLPHAAAARILIVDDNHVNREVVASLLKSHQLKYDMARNGLEAVEHVKQHHYDLVLMDLHMPVMDGYEATRQIRSFNKKTPVIALTATALDEDRTRAFEAGMNAFLTKPIEPKQFYNQLSHYVTFTDTAEEQLAVRIVSNRREKQNKQRILIVDDEVTNLKILANTLNKDYIVQVANQGERALKLCNSDTPPDLVLLDIQMPNMDGYELCKLLKENPKTSRIPIIFVTALSTPQSEEKGLNLGAVDYITKPYQMAVVQARIRAHINLKIKTDLLEQLSYIDGLTHIANRRHFDITLENELSRLQRSGQSIGLVMIDIDFFKAYNDNYGHGKGDECLQQVAKALSSVITRPSDLLARYGGEEFVVILAETDVGGVSFVAQKLRDVINGLEIPHEHSAVANHITISLGCVAEQVTRLTRADHLLKRVDDALYEAKRRGRDQVFIAQDNER